MPRFAVVTLAAFAAGASVDASASRSQALTRPGPTGVATRTDAENEAAARSDAGSLLSDLQLPEGATRSSTEPTGAGGRLAEPGLESGTPDLVDDHGWWIVPGPRAAVIEYVQAHRPVGRRELLCGPQATNGVVESECAYFAWPEVPGVLRMRWLVVKVVQLPDGASGLRADAEVAWDIPRPTSEVIPAGARLLQISVSSHIKSNQPRQRPLTVSSAVKIARIAALINELPAERPAPIVCPVDFGIDVRLAFYRRRGAAPAAVANDDPGGCGEVKLTVEGRAQPPREDGAQLVDAIDRVLGVRLDTAPAAR